MVWFSHQAFLHVVAVYLGQLYCRGALYLRAKPYFKKEHGLGPDDVQTTQQLMDLYARANDQAPIRRARRAWARSVWVANVGEWGAVGKSLYPLIFTAPRSHGRPEEEARSA